MSSFSEAANSERSEAREKKSRGGSMRKHTVKSLIAYHNKIDELCSFFCYVSVGNEDSI